MDRALNQLARPISIREACERPRDAYFCPQCGSQLNLRCGEERQCFAHQIWVEPSCPLRVDEGLGGYGSPRFVGNHDVRVVGWTLVRAFCKHLAFPLIPDDDARLGSEEVTKAQLVTVHLAHQEWDPSRFSPKQADAANVLSRLVSADLAGALRRILAARISHVGRTDFDSVPSLLQRAACIINWREYFSGMPNGEFLPSPWVERDEPTSLVYYPQQGRFGRRGNEIYHDVRYSLVAELAATGYRAHPLKLARLYRDAHGKRGFEIFSSNRDPRDRIGVSHGETLIIYRDPAASACLYVVPAAPGPTRAVAPAPPAPTQAPPTPPSNSSQPEPAPGAQVEKATCERCGRLLSIENEQKHAAECRVLRAEDIARAEAARKERLEEKRQAAKKVEEEAALAKEEARKVAEARKAAEARALDAARTYAASKVVSPEMVHIPGGIFWMGSGPDDAHTFPDEQPRHQVTLSPYWIARVPVTQKLYAHVMGRRSGYTVDDRLPVSLVSWLGAVQFCNRLSQHHCLARVYRQVGGVWVVQPDANGYRLATEAEWEYAARGEDGRIYPWGDTPPSPEVCWGVIGSAQWKGPYPVGGHPAGASALGLLDMVGNVRELVGDGYGPYSEASVVNPQGPDLRSCAPSCVVRGIGLRVASRTRLALDGRADQIGFRVARGNSPPAPRLAPTASKGDPTATLPGVMPTQSPPHAAPSRHASPMQIVLPQRVLSLPYRRPDEVPREETVRLRPFRRCPCCPAESPVPQGDLHEHLRQAHGLTVDASGRIVSYRGGGS